MKTIKILAIVVVLTTLVVSPVLGELRAMPTKSFYCEPMLGEIILLMNGQTCIMPWGSIHVEWVPDLNGGHQLIYLKHIQRLPLMCGDRVCGEYIKVTPLLNGTGFNPAREENEFFSMLDVINGYRYVSRIVEPDGYHMQGHPLFVQFFAVEYLGDDELE